MPFKCPQCSTPGSLAIVHRLELPPDSRSDEITLQIVQCSRCLFGGIAVYEESRRGALDSESFDHRGFRIDVASLSALKKAISQCPKPRNWRCKCATHRKLGRHDASGRWTGLDDVDIGQSFPMDR
jgi:hypothetical protein